MRIENFVRLQPAQIKEAAQVLTDSLPLGWADFDAAMREIARRLVPENTLLAALEEGHVIGWGGILLQYGGKVAELHPLAVKESCRGRGVGTRLIRALEAEAAKRGALTIWVGSDDESTPGKTSFAGVDLYEDWPRRLREFCPGSHPSAFYLKMGYTLLGALPDANGPGKPDIFLAKRLCEK